MRNITIKHLTAALLCGCMALSALSAGAAVTYVTPGSKTVSSVIEYDKIASMITKYNADYLQAENKIQIASQDGQDLTSNYRDSIDTYQNLEDQIKELDTQYAAYYAMANNPASSAEDVAAAQAAMADINKTAPELKKQLESLDTSIENMQKQLDMVDYNISASSLNATQTFKSKVLSAQQLFLSYYSLGHKRDAAKRKLETLERQLTVAETKFKMNMISKTEYEAVYDTIKPQKDTIADLNTQIRKSELNLKAVLGISLSFETTMGPLPAMAIEQIDSRSYPADLQEYLKKSITIQSKRDALQNAQIQQQYSDKAPYDVQNAHIALDQTIASETIAFEAAYNSLTDNYSKYKTQVKSLAAAEKDLKNLKTKLDKGLVSKNNYLNKVDEVYMTKCNLEAAKIDLFYELQSYLSSI